jgi:hypothetical protein
LKMSRVPIALWVLTSVAFVAAGQPRSEIDSKPVALYVSLQGNDAWSGTLPEPEAVRSDGPLATLHAAVEAARKQPAGRPRRIVMRGGQYYLSRPIVLDPRDSGLVIEADDDVPVFLYGGRAITGWRREGQHFWAADLPEVAAGRWDFRMLVVNDRFCPRARLPGLGHFTHLSRFDVPWMSTTGGGWKRKPTAEELTKLVFRPDDLGPWLRPKNAEVTVYHMWDESVVGVAAVDHAAHILKLASPCGHPPGAFGVQKYVVWNVREGMTAPGQWYLDREAGRVVYWPLPDEDMARATVLAPTMESIFRIQGTKESAVRDVSLRGLTLSLTTTPLVPGGFGAERFEGAVAIAQAENCRLRELAVVNVGGQGVKASGVRGLRIEECHVHQTGACGLIVRGNECLVQGNHVHHVGLSYPSAIGVSSGGRGGPGNRIEHNEIHDTPYSAVVCGGDDHRIEHNLIYQAMQQLHDGAGIYVSMCKRIAIRGNFVRDITDTGGYGASAYYLDEQAEDCLVEGNLALRVARPSHNHMARKNIIRNNVFVTGGDATITFARSSDFQLEHNVVAARGKITVTNPAAITAARGNILFSAAGKVEGVKLQDYRAAGTQPMEAGGGFILAEPGLAEYERGRVRFLPGSAAAKLGIEPIDVSGAGRASAPDK